VDVEEWPQPVDSDESDIDDQPVVEEPINGEEDPQFVERVDLLDLSALDEPGVGHNELAGFLEEHLLGMDEDEWVDICKLH
jgi:hypothetical protein